MPNYQYQLKDVSLRSQIDLRNHRTNIVQAINTVFTNATNVNIYQNYFEFDLSHLADQQERQSLGREIVKRDSFLDSKKRSYGYSSQLFIRMN